MSEEETGHRWDLFISHASEDKDSFVRPLAIALRQLGVNVWYDDFTLTPGDSISRSIDEGLAESRYALVVISNAFIGKGWPEYELRGLVGREIGGEKMILPIWHGVEREQVMKFSPPLADKLAILTSGLTAQDIALQILNVIRPDIYANHPRSQLEKMASGEALSELQNELERVKEELEYTQEELSQYKCPYCKAPITTQDIVVLEGGDDLDTAERFACGFAVAGGQLVHPCPSDPRFPKLDEFVFALQEMPKETVMKWVCYLRPKTDMARLIHVGRAVGRTAEDAKEMAIRLYNGIAEKWTPGRLL